MKFLILLVILSAINVFAADINLDRIESRAVKKF
jgi:hypothetical protein